jgi:hypothetical protein
MNKLKAIICSCFAISSLALAQHDHGHGVPTTDTRVAVEYPPAINSKKSFGEWEFDVVTDMAKVHDVILKYA